MSKSLIVSKNNCLYTAATKLWIPVTEALPDMDKDKIPGPKVSVFVTLWDRDTDTYSVSVDTYDMEKGEFYHFSGRCDSVEVTAWMYKPDPFNPEDEDIVSLISDQ